MYLFTRSAVAATGKIADAAQWAVEAAGIAASTGGLGVASWMTMLSPEVGGLSWSIRAESIAELHAATTRSLADPAYQAVVGRAANVLAGPPTDTLMELVAGEPSTAGPPAFANVVQTTVAPGHLLSGYAAGIEIAQLFTSITGLQALFLRNVTGAFGGVGWITGAPDIAAVDAANAKLAASADWPVLVDRAGVHFSGDSQTRMLRRLA